MTTSLETTVNNNLCIGCGLCAGICPSHNLKMQLNKFGEYNQIHINSTAEILAHVSLSPIQIKLKMESMCI